MEVAVLRDEQALSAGNRETEGARARRTSKPIFSSARESVCVTCAKTLAASRQDLSLYVSRSDPAWERRMRA